MFSPVAYTPRLDGGSPIPEENSMLATAIRRAKDAGVPKENIENALVKVRIPSLVETHPILSNQASKSKNDNGQAVTYEAMMHGSVGIIM
jgi:translational activator of cytochrome c oxidase 1